MGNVLLRGGIHRPRRIKIMKADGRVMKLRSLVSVKQILFDYPNHGIFEAPGNLTQPLPEKAELAAGHLYYLIPLPLHSDELVIYNDDSKKGPFAKASSRRVPSAGCRLQPPSIAEAARDSIKEEEEVDPVVNRGGLRVVSSSCSTNGSSVRVKLRLRKEEVASFLAANNLIMENIARSTIIQRPTRQSALSAWKPRLDTIDELHNPLLDS